MNAYEETNAVTKETVDQAMRSLSVMTKGFQQIAAETSEFTKRAFEQQAALIDKLFQARSFDKTVEIQNAYARDAYQAWVDQANRMGEICSGIAKEAYEPLENAGKSAVETGTQVTKKAVPAAQNQAA